MYRASVNMSLGKNKILLLCLLFTHPWLAFAEQEEIAHECGVALVYLRKPLSYYAEHYLDPCWGTKKLLTLIDKQKNRGQDGAGIAVAKLHMPTSGDCLSQLRAAGNSAAKEIIEQVLHSLATLSAQLPSDETTLKEASPFIGEVLLGHVRYATHSAHSIEYCQPLVHPHVHANCHFALAGNFNMSNTQELLDQLKNWGIVPINGSDTQAVLNMIAYYLDKAEATESTVPLDLAHILRLASKQWDGGYLFCGILATGDAFACRDPAGIRPGYYFINEEVVAIASEKAALMETFNLPSSAIHPIKPAHVLIMPQSGEIEEKIFTEPLAERQCVFERIYFSRPNDPDIYQERKALGKQLAPKVLKAIGGDLDHTIFTYVPNSSLLAFQGLVEEITHLARQSLVETLKKCWQEGFLDEEALQKLEHQEAKVEYLIAKNQQLRTFINQDESRSRLIASLYEITREIVTPETTLVAIDDSIVRGTTLRESLIRQLANLHPKKVIIVSSAPPVLYPDCYGIDMSQIDRFIAFQAAVALLQERGQAKILEEVRARCEEALEHPPQALNRVEQIYAPFSLEELSAKITELVTPSDLKEKGFIQIIYQSVEGLHQAIPHFSGDWYFTGNYPTLGGYSMLNKSYLNWCNQKDVRSY